MKILFETQQQQRYDLEDGIHRMLISDHIRFEEKYTKEIPGKFICRILRNFMDFKPKEYKDTLNRSFNQFLAENKNRKDIIKNEGKPFTVTVSLRDSLNEFFEIKSAGEKRQVINFLLRQYARLPFYERERIYFHKCYNEIEKCIAKNTMISLTTSKNKKFEVKPVKIEIDEHSMSHYLIGLSREAGSNKAFDWYSTKLSRIIEYADRHEETDLTIKEICEAEERIIKYGAAYINPDNDSNKNKEVWLTEYGYEKLFLKTIARQRPIPVSVEKSEADKKYPYILKFDCSDIQIENYFFLFGKEARVVLPDSLRKKLINKYKAALDSYSQTPDERSDR